MPEIFPTKLIKMIVDLHSKGFESLYLYSGMSPSGMHWRYEIGVIDVFYWPNSCYLTSGSLVRVSNNTDWFDGDLSNN